MHPLSRRGVALLATAATLGAGSLVTAQAASAASSTTSSASTDRSIFDAALALILSLIGLNPTPANVQSQVNGLNADQLAGLLANANTGQLNALLGGLNVTQLTSAVTNLAGEGTLDELLGPMNVTQIGDLLAPLSGGALSSTTGLLTTNTLVGALGTLNPAELASVVDGLTSLQTGQLLGALASGNTAQLTSVISALTGVQLTNGLGALSFVQIGSLLAPLTGTNLTNIVGSLTSGQLSSVLGTITNTAQLSGLLAAANTAQLSSLVSLVSALTPAQITSLLGQAGAPANIVTGMGGRASGIAAAPDAAALNGLLAQVQALLGGGLPTVPGTEGLLNTLNPLLNIAGLDTSLLRSLLTTASAALGTALPGPAATALQGVIGTLVGVIAGSGGAATTPGTTIRPATATPTAPKAAANAGAAVFTAYRASIGAIKVAKNRRSAAMTVTCPAAAPKGCLVVLDGKVAGKKAFAQKVFVVMRTVKQKVTVKLTSVAANRLKKKGGSLQVSARTANGTLASLSKTVKVAKPLKARAR